MCHSLDAIGPSERESSDIMPWLLAIAEVVNAGGRLAPQKATQKQLQELVDTYGSDRVWGAIKQFSVSFGMADVSGVEVLFHSHPELPRLLKTEEAAQRALSQWFEENSARVEGFRHLFCRLGKLMVPTITNKFAKGEATPEQRELLGKVCQILEKEDNNEENGNLHTGL